MKKLLMFSFLAGVFLLFACNQFKEVNPADKPDSQKPLSKYSNQVILDWNLVTLEALGGPTYLHSLLGARINAMVHLAMHDALNAVAPAYQTYALQIKDAQADPIAAAASAAHTVLVACLPDQKQLVDEALSKSLANIEGSEKVSRGLALGKLAGEAIITVRADDGALQDPFAPVSPSAVPGVYQIIPPYDFVFAPFWANMQPFSLQSPSQFRCPPQPVLNSEAYTQAFHEVKTLGAKNSEVRTSDQSFYAQFWYEGSEIGWNTIARVVTSNKKTDLLATARLFALVNMALADAYTAGWDSKFHYNYWRPSTAIRAAEHDGNPATIADASWDSFLETPPVQDYPSTHSALGKAAATVLASLLGDKTKFTMTSSTAVPVEATRSFNSFSQAAQENADSRVMAGIHFRFSCEAGMQLGEKIGKWTLENHLRPLGKTQ